MTTSPATLYNEMLHVSTALPPALSAGPTNAPDNSKCWHCHANTSGTVTVYSGGEFHGSLSGYKATPGAAVTPFSQPTSGCADCHAQMRPVGIVQGTGSDLVSMDHSALFTTTVTIGGVAASGVPGLDCSVCHRSPGDTWTDGSFHHNVNGATPRDCTLCHYPLMADAPKSDLTSGVKYAMRHRSAQLSFQACQTCHTGALAKATSTPLSATLWQGGVLHGSVSAQPPSCVECHAVSNPGPTQSTFSYSLSLGGTATNSAQWMSHTSSAVAGKDCALCHAADAKVSGSAWSRSVSLHTLVASPGSCQACHGLTNGGGTVPGTKNNLPSGLTNSSTVTTASSPASTGVPAGTFDQIDHSDVNAAGRDCSFCHTQVGRATAPGVQGKEWAQARFHPNFGASAPLVSNGTTGRCSHCHLNLKPGSGFTAFDHGPFNASTGQDCAVCHSWVAGAPDWKGSGGMPQYLSVGGFTISKPPATGTATQGGIANLPHPTVATGTACTTCHATAAGGKGARGYPHTSSLGNNCNACHEAGTNLLGTNWNNAGSQAAGAGDSRPYTLPSVVAKKGGSSMTVRTPNHFYPVIATSATWCRGATGP
jgi:mono/diheme cytochrome c family protein